MEEHKNNSVLLTESLTSLTNTVTKMETTMSQILNLHRKDPPSPDQEQPIKRSRIRNADTSPNHYNHCPQDEDMGSGEDWETHPPNLPSSDSEPTTPR